MFQMMFQTSMYLFICSRGGVAAVDRDMEFDTETWEAKSVDLSQHFAIFKGMR